MKDAPIKKEEQEETIPEKEEPEETQPETESQKETKPEPETLTETVPEIEPTNETQTETEAPKEEEKTVTPKHYESSDSHSGGGGESYVIGRGLEFNKRAETPDLVTTQEETPVTADVPKNARVLGARRTPKTGENRSMTTLLRNCSKLYSYFILYKVLFSNDFIDRIGIGNYTIDTKSC